MIASDDTDLPPVSAPVKSISSVPGYIMPGLPRKQFQDVLAKSASQPVSAMPGMRTFGNRTMSEFLPARYEYHFKVSEFMQKPACVCKTWERCSVVVV